jgi:hypothetical protein
MIVISPSIPFKILGFEKRCAAKICTTSRTPAMPSTRSTSKSQGRARRLRGATPAVAKLATTSANKKLLPKKRHLPSSNSPPSTGDACTLGRKKNKRSGPTSKIKVELPPTKNPHRPADLDRNVRAFVLKVRDDENRTKKRPWNSSEIEALCMAVKECGIGKWRRMFNCEPWGKVFKLNGRTNVDLKDKWRNMKKVFNVGEDAIDLLLAQLKKTDYPKRGDMQKTKQEPFEVVHLSKPPDCGELKDGYDSSKSTKDEMIDVKEKPSKVWADKSKSKAAELMRRANELSLEAENKLAEANAWEKRAFELEEQARIVEEERTFDIFNF